MENNSDDSPEDRLAAMERRCTELEKAIADAAKDRITENQFVSAIEFMIDLQAENAALWRVLDRTERILDGWPPLELAEERAALAPLRAAAASLPRTGLYGVAGLLGTLSRHRPGS